MSASEPPPTCLPHGGFDPIAEAARQWEAHWGREPVAAMTGVTSIMRVQQILLARLNALLKPWELSFPRYEALMLLFYSRRGSLPLGKMGARLQVHPTSVTSLVDGLERMELARREPHEHDRRTSPSASSLSTMLVTLVRWTCSRSPILPSGSEPRRVNSSSISAS